MTLFRAYASAYPSALGADLCDIPVFFEAENERSAGARLLATLSTLWGRPVHELDAYNVESEASLRESYQEDGELHPDAALLGRGYDQSGVTYLDASRPLLYVGPGQHKRLSAVLAVMGQKDQRQPRSATRQHQTQPNI